MNNNKQWWLHYGLKEEPNLSTDPLSGDDELKLFYGREKDILKFETLLSSAKRKTILLTGNPGVGKSTFNNRLFSKENGCIHVNLSTISKIENAELAIAEATLNTLRGINKRKYKRYKKTNRI